MLIHPGQSWWAERSESFLCSEGKADDTVLEDWLELVKHKKNCKKDKKGTYYTYTCEKGSVNFIEVNYT